MTDIKLATYVPEAERKDAADELRALADSVESGQILAFAWTAIITENSFDYNYIKFPGVSKVEVLGMVAKLQHEIAEDLE